MPLDPVGRILHQKRIRADGLGRPGEVIDALAKIRNRICDLQARAEHSERAADDARAPLAGPKRLRRGVPEVILRLLAQPNRAGSEGYAEGTDYRILRFPRRVYGKRQVERRSPTGPATRQDPSPLVSSTQVAHAPDSPGTSPPRLADTGEAAVWTADTPRKQVLAVDPEIKRTGSNPESSARFVRSEPAGRRSLAAPQRLISEQKVQRMRRSDKLFVGIPPQVDEDLRPRFDRRVEGRIIAFGKVHSGRRVSEK